MLHTGRLLKALQPLNPRAERSAPLPDNTLKEVILKAIGKPTSSDEIRYFKRNSKTKPVAPCFAGEIRPRLKLIKTAIDSSELPHGTLPEVAFYGRTNAGKSCLINAVCGRYGVCPVNGVPGTTRKVYFYKVGSPPTIIFVDMPGYGYSPAKEDVTMQWNEFALSYIKNRETLKLVVVLIDCRIGLKQSDLEVINFCDKYKVKWQIVLAKADETKPVLLAKMMHKVRIETSTFRSSNGKVIAVSSTKNQNLDELRTVLEAFKVDKHTAHFWTNTNESRKSLGTRKPATPKANEIVTVKASCDNVALGQNESSMQHSNRPFKRYDLWNYIRDANHSYRPHQVALQCVAEIFKRFTPPSDFVEDLGMRVETLSTSHIDNTPSTITTSPTFVEMEGGLTCDLHITLEETLKRNEETEVKRENLIRDKVASYQRRMEMQTEPFPRATRPNIGRSYKRVLSMYRSAIAKRKLKWDVVNQEKLTWSAAYQKWERWSKKHPQLAGVTVPPTKRQVVAEGRIIASIAGRNPLETSRMLVRELIEADPVLLQQALDLVYTGKISKVTFAPDQSPTSQCFYAIPSKDGTKQYLVMQGYCDCYHFAEYVLSRSTAFTCKHELACILLEHISAELDIEGSRLLCCAEELEEENFVERMHLLYDE
ncbi:putative GTP-binding protein EngB [Babesia sp. Xinjiang]|uniref:putative GTP-binding protein EngB n=1 Tax=Babesia sp. Xinjiang TaxID=462227 RepID=UPI000A2200C7|nr:putative GTP-binding protein EngB [Babesia sp. Xinjiang]ORM40378.1 putative GTP-binding protein EngB [Babesia sp. Xinjiang]